MNKNLALAALIAVASIGVPAFAHHSFAMFDQKKEMKISGTIKALQWTNPHIWIQVMAPDAQGKIVEWSIEGGSLNTVKRWGWKKTDLKPGEKVTLSLHPIRDGKNAGALISLKTQSGVVWGGK